MIISGQVAGGSLASASVSEDIGALDDSDLGCIDIDSDSDMDMGVDTGKESEVDICVKKIGGNELGEVARSTYDEQKVKRIEALFGYEEIFKERISC